MAQKGRRPGSNQTKNRAKPPQNTPFVQLRTTARATTDRGIAPPHEPRPTIWERSSPLKGRLGGDEQVSSYLPVWWRPGRDCPGVRNRTCRWVGVRIVGRNSLVHPPLAPPSKEGNFRRVGRRLCRRPTSGKLLPFEGEAGWGWAGEFLLFGEI